LMLRWISRISTYLLVFMFIFTLYSTISSRLNGGKPKIFGKEIMSVLSGSMEPGIQTGSIIAVTPVSPDQQGTFKAGDVITFRSADDPNMLITHRIVSVKDTSSSREYITKGDNNDSEDPKSIPSGNVVAKYDNFTLPYLGFFLAWVKTKLGIIVVMIIPGALLIISSIVSLIRSILRMEEPKDQKVSLGEIPPATNG
jgi:signal peptidase